MVVRIVPDDLKTRLCINIQVSPTILKHWSECLTSWCVIVIVDEIELLDPLRSNEAEKNFFGGAVGTTKVKARACS